MLVLMLIQVLWGQMPLGSSSFCSYCFRGYQRRGLLVEACVSEHRHYYLFFQSLTYLDLSSQLYYLVPCLIGAGFEHEDCEYGSNNNDDAEVLVLVVRD